MQPDAERPPIRRVDVLGVHVSAVDMERALDEIEHWIDTREQHYVCVTGVHGIMESQHDEHLRQIHNGSGLTTPDGMPLVWAGKLAGAREIDRVCGPELLPAACERASQRGWSMFLYGGVDGVPQRLAPMLQRTYPGLRIAGTLSPPFGPMSSERDAEIVELLNAADPDIVWVGLGVPRQERWMEAHVGRLRAPVLIGVGAAFDFHAGTKKRAPRWLRRTGFEWTYRLLAEPRRLWRRYLLHNPAFVARLLRRRPRLVTTDEPG